MNLVPLEDAKTTPTPTNVGGNSLKLTSIDDAQPTNPDADAKGENPFVEGLKLPFGVAESLARASYNIPVGALAKGAGMLTGLALGDQNPTTRGEHWEQNVTINPKLNASKAADEGLGKLYEGAKELTMPRSTPLARLQEAQRKPAVWNALSKEQQNKMEADAKSEQEFSRTAYGASLDAVMAAQMGAHGVEGIGNVVKSIKDRKTTPETSQEPTNLVPIEQSEHYNADFMGDEQVQPNTMMGQKVQSPYNLSPEQQAILSEEMSPREKGYQGDMLNENEGPYYPSEVAGRKFVMDDPAAPRPPTDMVGDVAHTPELHNTLSRMSEEHDMLPGAEHGESPYLNSEEEGYQYHGGSSDLAGGHRAEGVETPLKQAREPSDPLEFTRESKPITPKDTRTFEQTVADTVAEMDAKDAAKAAREKEPLRLEPTDAERAAQEGAAQKPGQLRDAIETMRAREALRRRQGGAIDVKAIREGLGDLKRRAFDALDEARQSLVRLSNDIISDHVHGSLSNEDFKKTYLAHQAKIAEIDARKQAIINGKTPAADQQTAGSVLKFPDRRNGSPPSNQIGAIGSKQKVLAQQRAARKEWQGRIDRQMSQSGSPVKNLTDVKKQFESSFGQKLVDYLDASKIDWNGVKDITDRFKLASNALIDRSIAILTQNKEGAGKLIKWAVDNREGIDREKDIAIPDGANEALSHWKTLRKTPEGFRDLRDMLTTWVKNIDKADLVRRDFKNDRQWEAYKKTHEFLDRLRDKVNDARTEISKGVLKPIAYINNYLPAIWEGDYRVWIKDQTGKNVGVFGFKTVREGNRAAKLLRDAHPDLVVEDAVHRAKSKYDLGNLDAFEEAIRIMSKTDEPLTGELQKTYAKILTSRGFSKHALERKGLFGYLGFDKGDMGIRNMERAIESHIKRSESHIANLRKADLHAQLQELPTAIRSKLPNTFDYLKDYLNNARGGDIDQLTGLTKIAGIIGRELGFGETGAERTVRGLSSFASLYWLVRPQFLLSQFAQPLNAFPKLTQQVGLIKAAEATFKGLQNAVSAGGRDVSAQNAIKFAQKEGWLDSALASMLDLKMQDMKGEGRGAISESARWLLSKEEHHVVRVPAYLMFEYALRDSIKDPTTRYRQAAAMMDYYMVHYDRPSSPLMYAKGGIAGEVLRPLKQYSHNAYGQFFEFSQGLKDRGEVAPLAAFLGVQALVSGLKGVMLAAEATVIINAINTVWNSNIPTPEKWLLTHLPNMGAGKGLTEALTYGGFSYILGSDVSSSTNAPSLPQMITAAPLEFSVKATTAALNYAHKMADGSLTEQDTMATALALTPSAAKGWIEEYFMHKNETDIVPNPNDRMRGNYHRPEGDYRWTLGMRSIDEAKANALVRVVKNDLFRNAQQKLETIDAISDAVMSGDDISNDLLEQYAQEGGDFGRLSSDIVQRIKDRSMTFGEREAAKGGNTPTKLKRLEIMEQDRLANDEGSVDLQSAADQHSGAYQRLRTAQDSTLRDSSPPDFAQNMGRAMQGFPSNPGLPMDMPQAGVRGKEFVSPADMLFNKRKVPVKYY